MTVWEPDPDVFLTLPIDVIVQVFVDASYEPPQVTVPPLSDQEPPVQAVTRLMRRLFGSIHSCRSADDVRMQRFGAQRSDRGLPHEACPRQAHRGCSGTRGCSMRARRIAEDEG